MEEVKDKSNLKKSLKKIGGLLLLIITALGAIAEFSGYSLKDFLFNGDKDTFNVTVLVHGLKGKDDIILENQGSVLLYIGDSPRLSSINELGEATFKGISSNYIGDSIQLGIKHNQPYHATQRDRKYRLEKNKTIYFEVELKNLEIVKGRVIDFESEKPLDSVRVSVERFFTYTDSFGWYELEVPNQIQAKFIDMNFSKNGYKIKNIRDVTPHTKHTVDISLNRIGK